jgi:hypothetical protein
MQYILMLYAREAGWSELTQAQQEQGMGAYNAYTEALKNAGVLMGVNRLQPTSTATTVRVANSKSQVLDGPYADSKEQLGGSTFSMCLISTPRSRGQRVARPQVTVPSRCVHSGASRREVPVSAKLRQLVTGEIGIIKEQS